MAKASEVARIVRGLLNGPAIPYVLGGKSLSGMDCKGMVEYAIREAGGTIKYSGSNDMWRNACTRKATLKDAEREGWLKPGVMLFIVENDGKEPDKYKKDGLGNASHVGIYIGHRDIHSVDASASKGQVVARNPRDAVRIWTHAAQFKEVDYTVITRKPAASGYREPYPDEFETLEPEDDYGFEPHPFTQPPQHQQVNLPKQVRVHTTGGRLNLRKQPRADAYSMGRMEPGTIADVLGGHSEWLQLRAKIGTQTVTGWAHAEFLVAHEHQTVAHPNWGGLG